MNDPMRIYQTAIAALVQQHEGELYVPLHTLADPRGTILFRVEENPPGLRFRFEPDKLQ